MSKQIWLWLIGWLGAMICLPSPSEAYPEVWRWNWEPPLKADDLLLEGIDSKNGTYGIYAITLDPEARRQKARLLIPGGMQPVWSPQRNYFIYLEGDTLRVVRRDGQEDGQLWRSPIAFVDGGRPEVHLSWWEGEIDSAWGTGEKGRGLGLACCFPLPPGDIRTLVGKGAFSWSQIRGLGEVIHSWFNEEKGLPEGQVIDYISFSPHTNEIVAETYPQRAFQLGRAEARIRRFRFLEAGDHLEEGDKPTHAFSAQTCFTSLGKRVTQHEGWMAELQPLWSLDGEWIAFIGVRQEGKIFAVVARPDGQEETVLIAGSSMWPGLLPVEYIPVGQGIPGPERNYWPAYPLEWAPHGLRLLVGQGWEQYQTLAVAEFDGAKWRWQGNWGIYQVRMSSIRFPQWAPDGKRIAYLKGNAPNPEGDVLVAVDVDREELYGQELLLPIELRILWLDW